MRQPLRLALAMLGIVILSIPVSMVVTILMFPFWSWLEAATGIESVGHSGPDDWCYEATFAVVVVSAALVFFIRARRKAAG